MANHTLDTYANEIERNTGLSLHLEIFGRPPHEYLRAYSDEGVDVLQVPAVNLQDIQGYIPPHCHADDELYNERYSLIRLFQNDPRALDLMEDQLPLLDNLLANHKPAFQPSPKTADNPAELSRRFRGGIAQLLFTVDPFCIQKIKQHLESK